MDATKLPSILSALLGSALMAMPTVASAAAIPYGRTPVAQLAPSGFDHHQVLRIDQDFHPNDAYEIALDAWVSDASPRGIAEVRMWWLDTDSADERSPFGKGVRRHIDIDYHQHGAGDWRVSIAQGGRRFAFDVERADDGSVAAYADVDAGGASIDHCRVRRSRLVAKKILGIPAGLKHLEVTCVDAEGVEHRGRVRSSRAG